MMTRETLNKLHELDALSKEKAELASELLRTAKDRHKDRTHKLKRDGKEIELTEKILWDEVFYIGPSSQAGQILSKEHPQVFEAYKEQDKVVAELKILCLKELGVDFQKLSLSDYLKLTESLYSLLNQEAGKGINFKVGENA